MKLLNAFQLSLLLFLPVAASAQPAMKIHQPDNQAVKAVSERITDRGTLHFRGGLFIAPESFFAANKAHLGLTQDDQMVETSSFETELGEQVARFQQHYRGIPVEGAEYIVRSRNGQLDVLKGRVAEGLDLDASLALSEDVALESALAEIDAEVYAWQAEGVEKGVRSAEELESAFPKGELIIVRDPLSLDEAPEYLLTWRFRIESVEPFDISNVYLNALTGEVVKVVTDLHEASNATGTVHTVYNGTHSFSTRKRGFPNFDYILKDKTRGEITVKNYSNVQSWGWNLAGHIDQGSNTWSRREASVHWAAQEAHDYFKNAHGRNGVNGSNEELRIMANAPTSAYSDDGSKSYMWYMNTHEALDVVGHEFTHGVIRHTSNLVYERESGALNESFADIFGTMVEREVVGDANYDWLMGSDFGAIRSLQNPNAFGDPSIRGGLFWMNQVGCVPSGANDLCGVHINSGVQNRWFSLLVDGGTQNGVTVNGVGETAARRVAYRNMTVELFAGADYDDAREGAIDAAEALYGACSNVVEQVTNAWAAVGVGGTFGNCVPPLSVYISGPYSGQTYTYYTFNAVVSGGVSPFTYQWYVNGVYAGSGSSLGRSFSSDGFYQIQVRVTDNAGQVRTYYHSINIGDGCDGPILQQAKRCDPVPL